VQNSKCFPTVKSQTSQSVIAFVQSDHWKALNYGDYLLHATAATSLNLTINNIGRDRFNTAMNEYKYLKNLTQESCKEAVHLPCSPSGVAQVEKSAKSCYIKLKDFGCGYACIDRHVDDYLSRQM
jgi:hypothetical protein